MIKINIYPCIWSKSMLVPISIRIIPPARFILRLNLLPILHPNIIPIAEIMNVVIPIMMEGSTTGLSTIERENPTAKASILVAMARLNITSIRSGLNGFDKSPFLNPS